MKKKSINDATPDEWAEATKHYYKDKKKRKKATDIVLGFANKWEEALYKWEGFCGSVYSDTGSTQEEAFRAGWFAAQKKTK